MEELSIIEQPQDLTDVEVLLVVTGETEGRKKGFINLNLRRIFGQYSRADIRLCHSSHIVLRYF
jgi:hypothetical protein